MLVNLVCLCDMLLFNKDNNFTNNFFNTIGVDFKMKNISLSGKEVRL